jgi:AGCS family alanine or glycine:cation symporter
MAVITSFLTGNAVQANTVADTMYSTFQIPSWISGVVTATFVGVVIVGGIKQIGKVTARLMPLMAIIYVLGALIILTLNAGSVIPAFGTIFSSAFTPEAGLFGVGSGLFLTTLVWGIKRGLFSNEAGQGSAPIAHGAAKTEEPVREGVVALLEPFIDTLVVVTMTGLVIVTTGVWQERHEMVYEPGNSNNAVEITDGSNTLIIEDGEPVNGIVERNDFETGLFFVDEEQNEKFSGTLNIETGNFTDEDGNVVATVYTSVIENGAPLTSLAFEKGLAPLFPWGKHIVTLSVLLFGVSTAISWSYYGDRSIQYLAGDKSIFYYKIVYLGMHFLGAIFPLATVWAIGDIALGLMTFPNIIALFALSGSVVVASKKYFNKMEELEGEN